MNAKFIGALLTFGLVVGGIAHADSLDDLGRINRVKIQLINNSGYEIEKVYMSLTRSDTWGSDILGSDTIPSGWTETINANPGRYDLKLVDNSGDTCEVRDVALNYDRTVTIERSALLHCEGYSR